MPKRQSSRDPNASALAMVQQIAEGTRSPYSEVSSALDNPALRKQLMRKMGRLGGPKGAEATAEKPSGPKSNGVSQDAAWARRNSRQRD
jgi:hypothetical protein